MAVRRAAGERSELLRETGSMPDLDHGKRRQRVRRSASEQIQHREAYPDGLEAAGHQSDAVRKLTVGQYSDLRQKGDLQIGKE